MRWGFDKWNNKGVIINARSETAAEKKMFAKPIAERRCIIPSTGFYEWAKTHGKAKIKYQFNVPDSPMLYMAGFYTADNFVILTRAANDSMADVHDRMPVILYKDELVSWLNDKDFATDAMNRDSIELVREAA
jgi:putative SOS response-associated peptidase YedK